MKNLLFGVIATVLFSNLSFGQDQLNFIKPEMYGNYHNELLKLYSDKYSYEEIPAFSILYDNLKKEFDILHPNVLSDAENQFYKNRLIEVLGNETTLNSANYEYLTTKGIKKFYNPKIQIVLIDLLVNPKNPEEVINNLNILLNDESMNSNDVNEIKKLLSVYTSSIEFWKDNTSFKYDAKKKCDPAHQVFFADLIGCMFGGIGSVGMSWAIYSIQQHNGGGCI
jgi:hypothetical protein